MYLGLDYKMIFIDEYEILAVQKHGYLNHSVRRFTHKRRPVWLDDPLMSFNWPSQLNTRKLNVWLVEECRQRYHLFKTDWRGIRYLAGQERIHKWRSRCNGFGCCRNGKDSWCIRAERERDHKIVENCVPMGYKDPIVMYASSTYKRNY